MQLREIQIVSFGVLSHARVRGLQPGLNVLHGPNEFGKTSLLEFARRILFGFPSKATRANQYLLPESDKNSGRLICETGDGRILTVSRTTGKSGGPHTVTTAEGTTLNEQDFAAALDYVSSDLYQKVFSVGLQELYEVDVVNLDEVKNRIYGAGLGGVRVSDLKQFFEKRADELFTKGGHKPRMSMLAAEIASIRKDIRDAQTRLAQYDDDKREYARLLQKAADLSAEARAKQVEQRLLENRERLYPVFLSMQRAQQQLRDMGEVPEVADEALVELQERQSDLKKATGRIEDTQEKLRLKRATLERINYDPSLIRNETDIRALSQSVAGYRTMREQLPPAQRELQAAQEQIQQRLDVLGEGWTEERVRNFTLTAEQNDSLRQQEARLRKCEESLDNVRLKLEVHRDHVRATGSKHGVPKSIRLAGLAVLALGGVGCVLSALNGDATMAIISGAIGLLGLLVALAPGASAGKAHDPIAAQFEAEIRKSEEALEMARTEWIALLKHLGFPVTLSPEAKDEMLREIELASRDLQTVDHAKARIVRLEETLSSIGDRYARVANDVTSPPQSTDVAAAIEALESKLDAARTEKVRQESLAADVRQLADEVRVFEETRDKEAAELSGLLSKYCVQSPEALKEKYQRFNASRKLQQSIDADLRTIETSVGTGEACSAFMESLAATTPEEILAALAESKERTATAENELTETNRLVGALDSELKAIVSAEDLVSREAEVETLLQQLKDAQKEWLTARIALWGIGTAVSRYEEERQPDVIRAAQSTFGTMTDGRYERLLKPIDSDELHVRDVSGNDRTVDQLSRGTREQLYLAMRLGLIEQYEQQHEPMPVIMDDILVNFDDERGVLAVEALARFAKDRQVIVMTCHESTLSLYRQAGATELEMERNGTLL
ncbi:MAG: AAA family ATPase [Dehalococcoidia bacterium]|nr:AAA family ATPase [Dehalococcoidia bacterium]